MVLLNALKPWKYASARDVSNEVETDMNLFPNEGPIVECLSLRYPCICRILQQQMQNLRTGERLNFKSPTPLAAAVACPCLIHSDTLQMGFLEKPGVGRN